MLAFPKSRLWRTARFIYRLFTVPALLGVKALVLDDNDNVLLLRHTYLEGWHLPGGGVDRGEGMAAAAMRELLEETGIEAMDQPKLLQAYQNPGASRLDHVALFHICQWRQAKPFSPNAEIAEIGFFPLDDLPEETTPATRMRLEEFQRGGDYAEFW